MRELFDSPLVISVGSFTLWAIGQAMPEVTRSHPEVESIIKALGPVALGVIALGISLLYAQRKDQQTMEWMSKENEEFRKALIAQSTMLDKLADRIATCPKKE